MEVFLEVTVQHKKYHAGFMDKMRQQPVYALQESI